MPQKKKTGTKKTLPRIPTPKKTMQPRSSDEEVKKPSWNEATQFVPGVSGNPRGRPPSCQNEINRQLREMGYTPMKPRHVAETLELLLGLPLSAVNEIAGRGPHDDKNEFTALMRIAAKELLSRRGGQALENYLDRVHGKATVRHDVAIKAQPPDLSKLTDEELEELAKINRKLLRGEGE